MQGQRNKASSIDCYHNSQNGANKATFDSLHSSLTLSFFLRETGKEQEWRRAMTSDSTNINLSMLSQSVQRNGTGANDIRFTKHQLIHVKSRGTHMLAKENCWFITSSQNQGTSITVRELSQVPKAPRLTQMDKSLAESSIMLSSESLAKSSIPDIILAS